RTVEIDEIGRSATYLLSDYSSGVTGEVHYVDSGYNIVSMPKLDELRAEERREIIEEKVEQEKTEVLASGS
ncbi:MAG: SDR family oxidoreductase, partial [Pseudomonadota bacterium]